LEGVPGCDDLPAGQLHAGRIAAVLVADGVGQSERLSPGPAVVAASEVPRSPPLGLRRLRRIAVLGLVAGGVQRPVSSRPDVAERDVFGPAAFSRGKVVALLPGAATVRRSEHPGP